MVEGGDYSRGDSPCNVVSLGELLKAKHTPLEILAETVFRLKIDKVIVQKLFGSYNMFLELLNDEDKRTQLDKLRAEGARTSRVYAEMRDIRVQFQRGLNDLFFHESLDYLTKEYGIF